MAKGFTWENAMKRALATEIRHNVIFCKGNINKDFDRQHPDWVREYAQNGRHTQMLKQTKEKVEKEQREALERRNKIGAGKR